MPGVHVIRDKDSHIAKVFWPNHDPAQYQSPPSIEENRGPNDEYVFFPNMNFDTVQELARRSVADVEGIVYGLSENTRGKDVRYNNPRIGRDGVWAEPATRRPPGLLGELEEIRKGAKKKGNDPLTFGDVEVAAKRWEDAQQESIQARREESDEPVFQTEIPLATSRGHGWRRATYTRIPGYAERNRVGQHIPGLQIQNAKRCDHVQAREKPRYEEEELGLLGQFARQGKRQEDVKLATKLIKAFAPQLDINPEDLLAEGNIEEIASEIVEAWRNPEK